MEKSCSKRSLHSPLKVPNTSLFINYPKALRNTDKGHGA